MLIVTRQIGILCLLFILCGFTTQPLDERQVQDTLPQSKDALWKKLVTTKIHYDEKKGLYSADIPSDIKEMVGKEITISGFILPLESTEKFKHFILSKRTPTCPFCPPGEPNEIVEVFMNKDLTYNENLLTVSGVFSLESNQEMGMFFKLEHGVVK